MKKKIVDFLRGVRECTCDSFRALGDLLEFVRDRISAAQDTAQEQAELNLARVNADRARANADRIRLRCADLEESEYPVFARAVFECLQDNGNRCGLEQPHHLEQIFAPEGQRVTYSQSLGICYRFVVRRAFSAGIAAGHKFEVVYADMYAKDMCVQLDEVMSTYSLRHGFRPVSVTNICDFANNRVIVSIASKNKT